MNSLRTLVVDDDRDFADGLAELVHAYGHDAVVLSSGQEAVAKLRDQTFDIAFVDVKMPIISGFDVVHAQTGDSDGCQIMLMTAFNLEDALAEEVERGSVTLVTQPFSDQEFLTAFRSVGPDGIVIVVDDSRRCGVRLTEILAGTGLSVGIDLEINNLRASVGFKNAEALVLDLGIPVIDSIEIFNDLKEKTAGVPAAIVVRAFQDIGDDDVLRSPETTGILFKPFDVEPILKARAEGLQRGNPNQE